MHALPNLLKLLAARTSGLINLAEILGIPPAEIIAFGDNENDEPMLARCGFPVVMENAPPALKSPGRPVAPRHDLGGVGLYLAARMEAGEL